VVELYSSARPVAVLLRSRLSFSFPLIAFARSVGCDLSRLLVACARPFVLSHCWSMARLRQLRGCCDTCVCFLVLRARCFESASLLPCAVVLRRPRESQPDDASETCADNGSSRSRICRAALAVGGAWCFAAMHKAAELSGR
jgi:hypothetical protein